MRHAPPAAKPERVQPHFPSARAFWCFTFICSFWFAVELGWIVFNWLGFIFLILVLVPAYGEISKMQEANWKNWQNPTWPWQWDGKAWLTISYFALWICILASNGGGGDLPADPTPAAPAAAPLASPPSAAGCCGVDLPPSTPADYSPRPPAPAQNPFVEQAAPYGYPLYAHPGSGGQYLGGFSHSQGVGRSDKGFGNR